MDNQKKTVEALREDVFAEAVELFESDRKAALAWLHQPLRAIGHEVPSEYMNSPENIQEVRNVIGRLEHGVWT